MPKTDNTNLQAKLDLCRHFLRRYHSQGARVFDAFAGQQKVWSMLRQEFALDTYFPVDVKGTVGGLKIDSLRVLSQPGLKENVFDLDCYGLPWKWWLALLQNQPGEKTVFLTIGVLAIGGSALAKVVADNLGFGKLKIPNGIGAKINQGCTDLMLGKLFDFGFGCDEAQETKSGNARYVGLHLIQQRSSAKMRSKALTVSRKSCIVSA